MPITVLPKVSEDFKKIINPESLKFLEFLHQRFNHRRLELLAARIERQGAYDAGKLPTFLPETAHIREGNWKCGTIPDDLQDRRVEITGPVDRKMVINALNSGASTYMADFEDSTAPTWFNQVDGQVNLYDAVRRNITFRQESTGKEYKLNQQTATLLVRPRGWHLDEEHVLVDGKPMSGSLFDFGLYFFHNAKELLSRGSGPYYYLPKMQSHLETRLWNDVFLAAQSYCDVPRGSIKATCLLETLAAAFEMDEMLYELREHSIGLNCGRWDYIFSYIKILKEHKDYILPDRALVTMQSGFMDAYVKLLIRTCHRRGTFAMGGMAAQIPIRNDKKANDKAMEGVRLDKLREVRAGHDGTWVAHPALVTLAKEVFDAEMKGKNQIYYIPEVGKNITQTDLLTPSDGSVSVEGIRENIQVCLAYTEAFLRGVGCIPYHNKMEDAATAEISRVQVWQWLHHKIKTSDGTIVTPDLIKDFVSTLTKELASAVGPGNKAETAGVLVGRMMLSEKLDEFLTLKAYPYIVQTPVSGAHKL